MLENQPDFKKIFKKRLEAIELYGEEALSWSNRGYEEEIGVDEVTKVACAVLFNNPFAEDDEELWILDPEEVKFTRMLHFVVEKDLKSFLKSSYLHTPDPKYFISSFVFEDGDGNINLYFDEDFTKVVLGEIRENEYKRRQWERFLQSYEINQVITHIGYKKEYETEYNGEMLPTIEYGSTAFKMINLDLIGQIRTERYIEGIAERLFLNNFQYLRFRRFVLCAVESGQSVNFEEIARNSVILSES